MRYFMQRDDLQLPLIKEVLQDVPFYLADGFTLFAEDGGKQWEISLEEVDPQFLTVPDRPFVDSKEMASLIESLLELMQTSMAPAITLLPLPSVRSQVQADFDAFEEQAVAMIAKYSKED